MMRCLYVALLLLICLGGIGGSVYWFKSLSADQDAAMD